MSALGLLFLASGLFACALSALLPHLQEARAKAPLSPLPLPETRFRLLQVPLSLVVKAFGTPITHPPADVMRAFHRGANLVVTRQTEHSRSVTWQA